jgi:hypothetical protein
MSDLFESEKKWKNVESSRSKSKAIYDEEKAEKLQGGVKKAGAKSPGEAMSESWENLKSGVSNLLGGKKK